MRTPLQSLRRLVRDTSQQAAAISDQVRQRFDPFLSGEPPSEESMPEAFERDTASPAGEAPITSAHPEKKTANGKANPGPPANPESAQEHSEGEPLASSSKQPQRSVNIPPDAMPNPKRGASGPSAEPPPSLTRPAGSAFDSTIGHAPPKPPFQNDHDHHPLSTSEEQLEEERVNTTGEPYGGRLHTPGDVADDVSGLRNTPDAPPTPSKTSDTDTASDPEATQSRKQPPPKDAKERPSLNKTVNTLLADEPALERLRAVFARGKRTPQQRHHLTVSAGTWDGHPAKSEPDVLLDVPHLRVDELNLEVEKLEAHVALQAKLANLVTIQVGADVTLEDVELDLQGVEAHAQLKVRLDEVHDIFSEAIELLHAHPELLTQSLSEDDSEEGTAERAREALKSLGKSTQDLLKETESRVENKAPELAADTSTDSSDSPANNGRERPTPSPSIRANAQSADEGDHPPERHA